MRRLRVNLGGLVLLATVAGVLLFGAISFYWVRRETVRALSAELDKRALHLARGLAVQAAEAILLEDELVLNRSLEETVLLGPEIAYAYLTSPDGEVLAHTFTGGFPRDLLKANPLPRGREFAVRRIIDQAAREAPLRDVVVPVAGGYAGFAHVGFRESLILTGVWRLERTVGVMVGVFIVLGLGAALLFSRMVTRPLARLAAAARGMNLGILGGAGPSPAEPASAGLSWLGVETEVDRLAHEFRRMVARLSTTYRDLRELQGRLVSSERLSVMGTIAAGVAHELNNPLAGISNCLRRIQREPQNREQLMRYLSVMQEAAERMEHSLRGLLDLSRPRRPQMRAVALEPLLDRVILLAGHRLAELRIVPQKEIQPDAATVWSDQYQLEQALLNLVLNACDALGERRQREPRFWPRLMLRGLRRDGRLHIEVEDNGVGIRPEDLPRVFEQFFTTKAPGQGTGLGLSIARTLLREHGGDIVVESQPGAGATFRIILNATGSSPA